MNLLEQVVEGLPPWRPFVDVSEISSFLFYDIPLAGVLRTAGQWVAFRNVTDEDPFSVWQYCLVSQAELVEAEKMVDGQGVFNDVDAVLDFLFNGKAAVFATARDLKVSGAFETGPFWKESR